eukprot:TRINITY_DN1818_c0_g1_i1.p1 TRINITY_DN1818_c0_g1~~TRINITY_DN1818_c0_g1_i1.p1  ORF type:complete len:1365 (+),score=167.49 TRINITY_DN1818_c0_g1_i1:168-4097(+)
MAFTKPSVAGLVPPHRPPVRSTSPSDAEEDMIESSQQEERMYSSHSDTPLALQREVPKSPAELSPEATDSELAEKLQKNSGAESAARKRALSLEQCYDSFDWDDLQAISDVTTGCVAPPDSAAKERPDEFEVVERSPQQPKDVPSSDGTITDGIHEDLDLCASASAADPRHQDAGQVSASKALRMRRAVSFSDLEEAISERLQRQSHEEAPASVEESSEDSEDDSLLQEREEKLPDESANQFTRSRGRTIFELMNSNSDTHVASSLQPDTNKPESTRAVNYQHKQAQGAEAVPKPRSHVLCQQESQTQTKHPLKHVHPQAQQLLNSNNGGVSPTMGPPRPGDRMLSKLLSQPCATRLATVSQRCPSLADACGREMHETNPMISQEPWSSHPVKQSSCRVSSKPISGSMSPTRHGPSGTRSNPLLIRNRGDESPPASLTGSPLAPGKRPLGTSASTAMQATMLSPTADGVADDAHSCLAQSNLTHTSGVSQVQASQPSQSYVDIGRTEILSNYDDGQDPLGPSTMPLTSLEFSAMDPSPVEHMTTSNPRACQASNYVELAHPRSRSTAMHNLPHAQTSQPSQSPSLSRGCPVLLKTSDPQSALAESGVPLPGQQPDNREPSPEKQVMNSSRNVGDVVDDGSELCQSASTVTRICSAPHSLLSKQLHPDSPGTGSYVLRMASDGRSPWVAPTGSLNGQQLAGSGSLPTSQVMLTALHASDIPDDFAPCHSGSSVRSGCKAAQVSHPSHQACALQGNLALNTRSGGIQSQGSSITVSSGGHQLPGTGPVPAKQEMMMSSHSSHASELPDDANQWHAGSSISVPQAPASQTLQSECRQALTSRSSSPVHPLRNPRQIKESALLAKPADYVSHERNSAKVPAESEVNGQASSRMVQSIMASRGHVSNGHVSPTLAQLLMGPRGTVTRRTMPASSATTPPATSNRQPVWRAPQPDIRSLRSPEDKMISSSRSMQHLTTSASSHRTMPTSHRFQTPAAGGQASSTEPVAVPMASQANRACSSTPLESERMQSPQGGYALSRSCSHLAVFNSISDCSEDDVAQWLMSLSTVPSDIIDVIHTHAINGAVLLSLTEEDLEGLDIPKFGHRRLLLLAAQQLRSTVEAQQQSRLHSSASVQQMRPSPAPFSQETFHLPLSPSGTSSQGSSHQSVGQPCAGGLPCAGTPAYDGTQRLPHVRSQQCFRSPPWAGGAPSALAVAVAPVGLAQARLAPAPQQSVRVALGAQSVPIPAYPVQQPPAACAVARQVSVPRSWSPPPAAAGMMQEPVTRCARLQSPGAAPRAPLICQQPHVASQLKRSE